MGLCLLHKEKQRESEAEKQEKHGSRCNCAQQRGQEGHNNHADGVDEAHVRRIGKKLGGTGVVSRGPASQADNGFPGIFGGLTGDLGGGAGGAITVACSHGSP